MTYTTPEAIEFAVWAPDEETFRQSWIAAGILQDEDGYVYSPAYSGVECSATQGWNGLIIKTPAVLDEDGNEVTPAVMVDGWHCNVRVTGQLVAEMTHGLSQYTAGGSLKSVFDRTWATHIFQLNQQPADTATGFPAGYRSAQGVTYSDMAKINTPANVRA